MKELVGRPALTREQERDLADRIRRAKAEVEEVVRGLLLKAADALDAAGSPSIRDELCAPMSDRQVNALSARIRDLAAVAARCVEHLDAAAKRRRVSRRDVSRARARIEEIARGFGMTPEDLAATWAAISERRAALDDARRSLFEGNLRLVVTIARRFEKSTVETADLVQEGNIALMRAVEAYDPSRGVPFAAFAGPAIRRAMAEFVRGASKPVRVPKQVDDLRRRIRRAAWYLATRLGRRAEPSEIADYLEMPSRKVVDAITSEVRSVTLDAGEDEEESLVDRLRDPRGEDPADIVATDESRATLDESLVGLPDRDRRVITMRYGSTASEEITLEDVGRSLGVTRERARQLEARALRSLRLGDRRGPRRNGHPVS